MLVVCNALPLLHVHTLGFLNDDNPWNNWGGGESIIQLITTHMQNDRILDTHNTRFVHEETWLRENLGGN